MNPAMAAVWRWVTSMLFAALTPYGSMAWLWAPVMRGSVLWLLPCYTMRLRWLGTNAFRNAGCVAPSHLA